jgi:hypothetical protein
MLVHSRVIVAKGAEAVDCVAALPNLVFGEHAGYEGEPVFMKGVGHPLQVIEGKGFLEISEILGNCSHALLSHIWPLRR